MKKGQLILLALATLLISSITGCKDKDVEGNLLVEIMYKVGADNLTTNSVMYTNNAGNNFSVTKSEYYLSDFELFQANGESFKITGVNYVNQATDATNEILLEGIPEGTYTKVTFTFGVPTDRNVTNGLENTTENVNMVWPDPLGGGYHFMKLEGFYLDSASNQVGYGMHLGKEGKQFTVELDGLDLTIDEGEEHLHIIHDIMEWHQNPADWNFNTDGTAIMMNDAALTKLSTNGANGAFSVE